MSLNGKLFGYLAAAEVPDVLAESKCKESLQFLTNPSSNETNIKV